MYCIFEELNQYGNSLEVYTDLTPRIRVCADSPAPEQQRRILTFIFNDHEQFKRFIKSLVIAEDAILVSRKDLKNLLMFASSFQEVLLQDVREYYAKIDEIKEDIDKLNADIEAIDALNRGYVVIKGR